MNTDQAQLRTDGADILGRNANWKYGHETYAGVVVGLITTDNQYIRWASAGEASEWKRTPARKIMRWPGGNAVVRVTERNGKAVTSTWYHVAAMQPDVAGPDRGHETSAQEGEASVKPA